MSGWVWIFAALYTFVMGYVFARKADAFMDKHPQAFPGRRPIMTGDLPAWQDLSGDDRGASRRRYTRKEHRNDEKDHS